MKDKYFSIVDKFNLTKKTKNILKKQIEYFFEHENNKNNNHQAKDEIILTKNNLIHGSRATLETLEKISKNGLIASEFYSELNKNKKKPYVVELWDIKEKIKLSDWVKKYAGVTIDFKNKEGNVYKSVITSFENLKINIQKEKDFRDYIIYQNQEQRFIPNDIIENEATVAFIIEYKDNEPLIQNDIFNTNFDDKIIRNILPAWFYQKYMKNRNFDNYETGREKAILFGIPTNMIKGIMVSRKLEKNQKYIKELKKLFPICYICNIDGIII